MPTLNLDRSSIHYEDFGEESDARPSVILLHGFPLDGRVWVDVADRLKHAARVIVPDLPGFGRSVVSEPFSMDTLAEDVVTISARLRLGRFVLAGLSMGGYVAQAVVRGYASKLSGLVLCDTRAAPDDESARQKRNEMIELVRTYGTPAVVDVMLPNMLHSSAYAHRTELVHRLKSIMLDQGPRTIEYAVAAIRDRPDGERILRESKVPGLVICGDDDRISPASVARSIGALRSGIDVEIIQGAGHMATIERPEAVASAIESAISRWHVGDVRVSNVD
jgi:pimeloyl-ACP methyl ester carboxylesterase